MTIKSTKNSHTLQNIHVSNALSALHNWQQLGINGRAAVLRESLAELDDKSHIKKMATWQINNALATLSEQQVMPGPTGESNTLSSEGRGVFLCTYFLYPDTHPKKHDEHTQTEALKVGIVGQVYAALCAGNCVLSLDKELTDIITKSLAANIPNSVLNNVIQTIDVDTQQEIIADTRLAGVAMISSAENIIETNQILANKEGLLCQLVAETITKKKENTWDTIANPNYILRFITEKTVTNNTTAVGGNASLLELGSMDG